MPVDAHYIRAENVFSNPDVWMDMVRHMVQGMVRWVVALPERGVVARYRAGQKRHALQPQSSCSKVCVMGWYAAKPV